MTDVQLPDGTIGRFPDHMGDEEILQALREQFPPTQPQRSFGQTVYENVIGSAEVDTPGERFGAAVNDAGQAFIAGASRGVTGLLDMVPNVFNAANDAAATGLEAMGADEGLAQGLRAAFPVQSNNASQLASDATGGATEYRGDSRASRIASTVGEFMPLAMAGGAPVSLGVIPGVASELSGEAAQGQTIPGNIPLVGGMDTEPFARVGAAVAAPSALNAARRAITPNPADPTRVAATEKLRAEGVDVTAGQKTGREALKYREALSPRTNQMVADQNQQFTRAALKRIGADADRATPQIMRDAKERIGKTFAEVTSDIELLPNDRISQAARDVVRTYGENTAKTNIAPVIRNIAAELEPVQNGLYQAMKGTQYKNYRSQLSKLTTSTDSQLAEAAKDLIGVLDDAMTNSLLATGNTQAMRTLADARSQWQDFLAIETAVSRAGEDAAAGILSPQTLRNAIAGQSRRSYTQGERELGELARAGATVTGKLPQTGAFPRAGLGAAGEAVLGPGAGAMTYALTRDPILSATAGIGMGALPAARNAMAASRTGQAYLGNQLIQGSTPVEQSLIPLFSGVASSR
ncbi:hypothetical protein [Ruegeria hyattellae]|uniref:hypothetical protein n=1 Tax=Ruegeria hyattellae TaxID=3233337 RepID=UPI00355C1240